MTTTTVKKLLNATVTCPFCGGSGHLPHYSHIQNGDCFACGASGQLRDLNAFIGDNSDIKLTVFTHCGEFSSAILRRRTWRTFVNPMTPSGFGTEWGRDAFVREINNVDEARKIWRNAKQLGIITELVD